MRPIFVDRQLAFIACILLWPLFLIASAHAQEKPSAQAENRGESLATLKGRIVQHPNPDWKVDLTDMEIRLVEFVLDRLPEPKLPDDWPRMTDDQRRQWVAEYEASEEGKQLLAEQERVLESARTFDVPIETSGEFVVFDVPPGTYGMSGRLDRTIGDYQYAFEVFGQIIVSDEVDEILLDPIAIVVTPLFQPGQPVPAFAIESADGHKIGPENFKGQFVFINAWSAQFSPPSLAFQTQIQQMAKALGESDHLRLLSVCLDQDRSKGIETIRQKSLAGVHGFAPGWDHPFAETMGVRALPWFMLVDPDGKIRLTHGQIRAAFAQGKQLQQIVAEGIQGLDPAANNDPAKSDESK